LTGRTYAPQRAEEVIRTVESSRKPGHAGGINVPDR